MCGPVVEKLSGERIFRNLVHIDQVFFFLGGALNKSSSSFAYQLWALKMAHPKVAIYFYAEMGGPGCYG